MTLQFVEYFRIWYIFCTYAVHLKTIDLLFKYLLCLLLNFLCLNFHRKTICLLILLLNYRFDDVFNYIIYSPTDLQPNLFTIELRNTSRTWTVTENNSVVVLDWFCLIIIIVCVGGYVSMYVGGGVWVCVFMRKSDSNYQFYLDHPVMVQVQERARKMILKCNTYIFTSATLTSYRPL